MYPNIDREFDAVIVHTREGDGWVTSDLDLDEATALPAEGSA